MIAKPVLLTLAWRWRTIGCLPYWGVAMIAFVIASSIAESAIHGIWRLLFDDSHRHVSKGISGFLPNAWVAGVALGFVVAWTVHELLRCPISATLPNLRRRLTVEVAVGLAVVWMLPLWMLGIPGVRGGTTVSALFAALGILGSGVGLVVANPARFRTLASASALIVGMSSIAHLLELSERWMLGHASVVVPVLAAVGIGCVALAFSAGEHRRLLASNEDTSTGPIDPVALDMSHRDQRAASFCAPAWRRGREWARATLHELHGASPFGWTFDVGKYLTLFVVLLVLVVGGDAVRGMGFRPSIWHAIAQNAVAEDRVFWRTIVSFWLLVAAMWAASVPCVPRVGFVRPATRAERARSAWSVAALRTGALLAGVTFLATVLGAIAVARSAALGDPAIPVRGLPDLLGAIAIVGIVAPWAAWIRLGLLDLWTASGRFPNPFRQGVVATATVVACEVAGHLLGNAWFAAEEAHPAFAPLLFAPALVGSWLAYRAVLDRLFRTVALPV